MANMNQMLMGMGGDGGLNVSGGNVTDGIEDGDYTYFVFTNASSSSLVVSGGPYTVDVLAIAGAGGGGSGHAGGGGAGGLVEVLAQQIGSGTHAQSVGEGGPAGGPAAGSGNRGTSNGEPTVFSPGSPQYQIVVTGGGRGGGGGGGKYGDPGGSGGGNASSSSSGTTWPGRSADACPTANRFNGNGTSYGHAGGQNNNGQTSRGGSGGGGAGTEGQPIEPGAGGDNYNPSTIPSTHPNHPNGGGDGPGAQVIGTPLEMITGPYVGNVWPDAANHPHGWQWGAFGGHGKKVLWAPGPVIAPGIPAPESPGPAFTGAVGAGYYAGGGGGGGHRPGGSSGDRNLHVPLGGGAGGIGGGGNGAYHDAPSPWWATPGAMCVGAGGGGGGQQDSNGGTGGSGLLVFRFRTDGS